MNLETLKVLGFTEGEVKVYGALIKLQKSTISKIIEYSGVSSSKVYLILDKLVHKGLINYIINDNIREFHLANPNNLLEYIKNEKSRINQIEESVKKLTADIKKFTTQHIEESAHIYRGIKGLKSAYLQLLHELNKGDEYVFFSVDKAALKQNAIQTMFKSIQLPKEEKGVLARGIALPSLRKTFEKHFPSRKEYRIRYHDITLNQGLTIGKNRIIMEMGDAFAVEIVSLSAAKKYKVFFDKIWKLAQP